LKPILAERLKVYNNLAASQMKIQAFDSALSSVENVLRCEPNNIKALFRKGKVCVYLNGILLALVFEWLKNFLSHCATISINWSMHCSDPVL
jgi:hypothetical protein